MAWYCDSCQVSAARLDARVRAMEGNLAGVETKIVHVESNVIDNTRRIQEIEKKLEGQDTARAAEKNNLRKEWNEEAREREVRRKNIVVLQATGGGGHGGRHQEELGHGQPRQHPRCHQHHLQEQGHSEVLQESW